MTPTTTIPFTITDEAVEYIRSLGLQKEFEQIIEFTKQFVPGLLRLDVRVQPPYDMGGPDGIIIGGMMRDPQSENDPTHWDWDAWIIRTFPPEVFQYFTLLLDFGGPDAR